NGQIAYALLTRAPLYSSRRTFSFDLHVLGPPLTFALSQDQTLQLKSGELSSASTIRSPGRSNLRSSGPTHRVASALRSVLVRPLSGTRDPRVQLRDFSRVELRFGFQGPRLTPPGGVKGRRCLVPMPSP